MTDQTDKAPGGFGIDRVGIDACGAIPVFGVLAAEASIAALAGGGLLLAAGVAGLGAAFLGWRRVPASTRTTPPIPVTVHARTGR